VALFDLNDNAVFNINYTNKDKKLIR